MTAFNKSRPKPDWLSKSHENKNTQRGQRYYNHLWNAQPDWADVKAIRAIYRRRDRLKALGHDVEVDHIVPLIHPLVCGLHVPWNLRICDRSVNATKSNKYFPGMPFAQGELFHEQIAPDDFELELQHAVNH